MPEHTGRAPQPPAAERPGLVAELRGSALLLVLAAMSTVGTAELARLLAGAAG